MKSFAGLLAAISAFVGILGFASAKSDIQIIIGLLGFGFAGAFILLGGVIAAIERKANVA